MSTVLPVKSSAEIAEVPDALVKGPSLTYTRYLEKSSSWTRVHEAVKAPPPSSGLSINPVILIGVSSLM